MPEGIFQSVIVDGIIAGVGGVLVFLPNILLLFLAIAFLVFAFAQPFIPASDNDVDNQNNVVGIYIDNSFSMESVGENGSLLNEAKAKAIEVVNSYRATDKFILITNLIGNEVYIFNNHFMTKCFAHIVNCRC